VTSGSILRGLVRSDGTDRGDGRDRRDLLLELVFHGRLLFDSGSDAGSFGSLVGLLKGVLNGGRNGVDRLGGRRRRGDLVLGGNWRASIDSGRKTSVGLRGNRGGGLNLVEELSLKLVLGLDGRGDSGGFGINMSLFLAVLDD